MKNKERIQELESRVEALEKIVKELKIPVLDLLKAERVLKAGIQFDERYEK